MSKEELNLDYKKAYDVFKQVMKHGDFLLAVKSALEKQMPKKPIWNKDDESRCCCPTCGEELYIENHHCKCGQALDWSDTE